MNFRDDTINMAPAARAQALSAKCATALCPTTALRPRRFAA
jgi:hypothetical protein